MLEDFVVDFVGEEMSADNLDHVFKILLIGDAGVGKSR